MKRLNINTEFTREEIEIFLNSRKKPYFANVDEVISYWDKKNWLTEKGAKVSSVSVVVNVANSYFVSLNRKKKVVTAKKEIAEKNTNNEWVKSRNPYSEQLDTPQWKAFREFIFVVRGHKCEVCGKPTKLQIHHLHYVANRFAWEYLPNDVIVVCNDCHRNIHKIKDVK